MRETEIGHKSHHALPAAAAAGGAFALWQIAEQRRFRITRHKYLTGKVTSMIRIVCIADLHDHVYGPANTVLLDAVEALRPDIIVIPGDFFTHRKRSDRQLIPPSSTAAMLALQALAPVYYSFGNHESRIMSTDTEQRRQLIDALDRFRAAGVRILRNDRVPVRVGEDRLEIAGFEPDGAYYCKGQKIRLRDGYLQQKLGEAHDPQSLQVLLAHPPAFFDSYAASDADIVFSGHTHGGLVRIPGVGSVVSPELSLFPKYDRPIVSDCGTTMYVSRGLGTHTVHLRVFDPAEIVVTDVKPLG